MFLKLLGTLCLGLSLGTMTNVWANSPEHHAGHKSSYAGEEKRQIKSLSSQDVDDLTNGKGWGLAKAAELNGIPGPSHLLEMKEEINLTSQQLKQIQSLYEAMKNKAMTKGIELVSLERQLNHGFADRTMTEMLLATILDQIAASRKDLRFIHLSTHLKTPDILTAKQIHLYNQLRGYDDPHLQMPKGHDPVMWKKHNNGS